MKTYSMDELKAILKLHKDWLFLKTGGKRADLQYADLQYADLQGADLKYADLKYADLQYAYLQGAHLQYAHLQYAHLQYAHLQGADLKYADLKYADLQYAYLQGAHLQVSGKKVKCKSSKIAQYIGSDYYCIFIGSIIKIGCECHYRSKWEKFSDRDIFNMDGKRALKFWRKEKSVILKISKNLSK